MNSGTRKPVSEAHLPAMYKQQDVDLRGSLRKQPAARRFPTRPKTKRTGTRHTCTLRKKLFRGENSSSSGWSVLFGDPDPNWVMGSVQLLRYSIRIFVPRKRMFLNNVYYSRLWSMLSLNPIISIQEDLGLQPCTFQTLQSIHLLFIQLKIDYNS